MMYVSVLKQYIVIHYCIVAMIKRTLFFLKKQPFSLHIIISVTYGAKIKPSIEGSKSMTEVIVDS